MEREGDSDGATATGAQPKMKGLSLTLGTVLASYRVLKICSHTKTEITADKDYLQKS